ncbi:hypothetical protein JTE90_000632 [Oedothorax gibbosus]|uniref:Uncharacterized protein n=1 Tax=Oedothorax gibbosus TaxID=931172 RepID=A0AAV6VXW0_9ARAC|nr:hypothetical protein JTE90_000632 [Oedothorax gibbosus]
MQNTPPNIQLRIQKQTHKLESRLRNFKNGTPERISRHERELQSLDQSRERARCGQIFEKWKLGRRFRGRPTPRQHFPAFSTNPRSDSWIYYEAGFGGVKAMAVRSLRRKSSTTLRR